MEKNTGNYAFFRQLIKDGCSCIFGNPGSSEENLLDTLQDEEFKDLKYFMGLHEGSVVAMADSYARALKKAAVVQLHSYAGLANGLGMLSYAKRGQTPMIVIAGEAGLKYDALDGQMGADLVAMAKPFVKSDHNGSCAWRVIDNGSFLRLLRRAIKTAMTPPCGPVFLALPMDVLNEINLESIVETSIINTKSIPEISVIENVCAALSNAKSPLMLIGDRIASANAQPEVQRVAELIGASVWGVFNSEVNFDANHPLYCGDTGHMFGKDSIKITSNADVVLICGTSIMPEVFPSLEGVFRNNAFIIHFDTDSYEIAKNFPVSIGMVSDIKLTLGLLADHLQTKMNDFSKSAAAGRYTDLKQKNEEQRLKEISKDNDFFKDGQLHVGQFIVELNKRLKVLSKPAVVFDEALTNSKEITRYLARNLPGTYYQTRAGMLGTGIPGTIGLKIAFPDRVVLGFIGDGGSISTIQALNTAARYNIGAKFIVCNNSCYKILKNNIIEYWAENDLTERKFPKEFYLTQLDFVKLAEGHGVRGVKLTKSADIPAVLELAFANDDPFLIELILNDK